VEQGYKNASLAIFNELNDKVVERLHEMAADPAKLGLITGMFGDMGKEGFRKSVGGRMIESALTGIKPGDPNYARAQKILGMGPQLWTTRPGLMNEVMQMTGDIKGTWSQGKVQVRPSIFERRHPTSYMTPVNYDPLPVPATKSGAFGAAMESVFGAEQLEVQRETLGVLKSIDAKLGGGGVPLGERASGNTDQ
jgi:hypothetical protein